MMRSPDTLAEDKQLPCHGSVKPQVACGKWLRRASGEWGWRRGPGPTVARVDEVPAWQQIVPVFVAGGGRARRKGRLALVAFTKVHRPLDGDAQVAQLLPKRLAGDA